MKSLDELRKETNKETTPQKGASQQLNHYGQSSVSSVPKAKKLQAGNAHFGAPNSVDFRAVSHTQTDHSSSQNHASSLSRTSDRNQVTQQGTGEPIPSFELGTVLKDVVSRLNSSTNTKKSSTPTCSSTGASSPALGIDTLRGNIFSRLGEKVRPGSIFDSNYRQVSERVVPTSRSSSTASVQGCKKSKVIGDADDAVTIVTQKRPHPQEAAKPEAKRVSPFH